MEASHADPGARQLWVALDARMRELYVARYQVEQGFPVRQGDELLLTADQLPRPPDATAGDSAALAGNGWQTDYGFSDAWVACLALQPPILTLPRAIWGVELALVLLQQDAGVIVAPEQALPVYLRDKVTWDKKPKVGE